MEKRISLESRGKDPAQVSELNLDNCRTVGEFEGLTSNFANLTKLSVIKAGLTSFKGFPTRLKSLQKLDVSENRISNGLHHIQDCESLTHLCLSGNKFKELTVLEPLTKLDKLSHLELANTPLSETDDYRTKVFSLLPNIHFLDGQDKDGNEASSSEDEGEEDDEEGGQEGAINGVNDKDLEDEEDVEGEELEEESEDDSEEEDEGPGLAALYTNSNLEEDSEDEDFNEDGVDQEDEDDDLEDSDEDTNNVESTRGKKRKHEEEETG